MSRRRLPSQAVTRGDRLIIVTSVNGGREVAWPSGFSLGRLVYARDGWALAGSRAMPLGNRSMLGQLPFAQGAWGTANRAVAAMIFGLRRDCIGVIFSGAYVTAICFGLYARRARFGGWDGVVPASATWAVTLQPQQKQNDISQDY